ncbi:MAG: alpha/beta fold hydrolase [Polyangiaceae bacterium]
MARTSARPVDAAGPGSRPRTSRQGGRGYSAYAAYAAPSSSSVRPDGGPDVEEIEIRTSDGWDLRAGLLEPAVEQHAPKGVAVLAHAFMARRSEFHRVDGGLAGFLAAAGWKVVSFDFRGHGDSTRTAGKAPVSADYGYDDLVRGDLPAVVGFARSRLRGKGPVVVVGHSLGGHTSLVAQATGAIEVDALVGFGASPWVRAFEPSAARWAAKRALLLGMAIATSRVGRFPARALRRGSDDESRVLIADVARFASRGWGSADGARDYLEAIGSVRVPVLQVVSTGDRLECAPECGAALLDHCGKGAARDLVRIEGSDDGSPAPGHMAMVTSERVKLAWARVTEWMSVYAAAGERAAAPRSRR